MVCFSYYFHHLLSTLHSYIVKSSFRDSKRRSKWHDSCVERRVEIASHMKGFYCSPLFNADEIPRNSNSWPNSSQPNSLDVFIEGFCQTTRITSLLSNLLPYWIWKNDLIGHCVMVQFNLIVKSSRVLFIILKKEKGKL